jgi:nucleotide-binding universal stress UspA family protein
VVVPAGHAAAGLPRLRPPVVVGFDGDRAARRALRVGLAEARLRNSPLVVLYVLDRAYVDDIHRPGSARDGDLLSPVASAAAQMEGCLAVAGDTGGVTVLPTVVSGDPCRVLLDWTAAAARVVVGRRAAPSTWGQGEGVVEVLRTRAQGPAAVIPETGETAW